MERRLAAILAADMVGYSRLMGADEEGTIARQRDHRAALIDPQIASHGGRIVKTMGDGLLVEFPSVVDAVKCAVALQAGMAEREAETPDARRIQYRIGINLGDIVIDGDDILGDGVNVAARLEGLAEPGGVCISDVVHQSIDGKLDLVFADMGAQQVKNIAKPVRAFQVLLSGEPESNTSELALPDKPSIAVLPFDNMSGDPEQEYFSDGMAEDLITDLSKISNLSVAARNSSFSFKGQMPDIKDVVEKLGVTFVLEGSVRKMGDRLRINAQLIDGADGRHLWAERYDGDMAEIFEFQDNIREQIVSALQVSLTPADKALTEHKQTDSVEAYDLFLKGRANLYRFTLENVLEAKKSLETALELDPNFADAYGFLSYCHFAGWILKFPGFDDTLELANILAEKGVSLDGTSAIAVARLAWIQGWMRQFDQAIANFEKALALAPNQADVYADFGQILNYWGDPERALEMSEKVFSLDTFAPPLWDFYAGHSYYLLRKFDQALPKMTRMVERVPKFITGYAYLACVYVEMNRLSDARDVIAKLLEVSPNYTLKDMDRLHPYRIDEVRDRFLGSLRKAGLPEDVELEAAPALPDKPSVAVLPFDNMSGDPEQGYFADGIAEDIITDLSKVSGLFVIARNSSFAYRGDSPDIRHVCRDLGVRYILEGSVRKAGNRVRINAQLIEGDTGGHIWAERYDRDIEDIFAVQDEVTREIVNALQVALTVGEQTGRESRRKVDPQAYDLFVRGRERVYQFTEAALAESRDLLERAISFDADMAVAHALLSLVYSTEYLNGWNEPAPDHLQRGMEIAERACRIDPLEPQAYHALALANLWLGQFDDAERAANRAVELNPNFAGGYASLGQVHELMGDHTRAIECAETALSLDPLYHTALQLLGRAQFALGRDEEAAASFEERLVQSPNSDMSRAFLAAIHGHAGRHDEARQRWREIMGLNPNFSIAHVRSVLTYKSPAVLDRLADGLDKAGLPEGGEPEEESLPLPDKPSIAVLPFENMSGDPEQEYFADGITDDIITDLSKLSGLFVIARNSSFAYKGQSPNIRKVTHELGVGHILEGSVRRSGGRVRINAQLVDARTSGHLWAERYDGNLEDIFNLQDEITAKIVAALQVALTPGEQARSGRQMTENMEAYDLYVRARATMYQTSKDANLQSRTLLLRSIELDSDFAEPYALLSYIYMADWTFRWTDVPDLSRAYEMAERAVALDDELGLAHARLGWLHLWDKTHDAAIAELERAIQLDPNDAEGYAWLAEILNYSGDPERSLEMTQRAMRLNPHYPAPYVFHLGHSYFLLKRYDEAEAAIGEAITRAPGFPVPRFFMAVLCSEIDKREQAREHIDALLTLMPDETVTLAEQMFPYRSPEHLERFLSGLRKAGLPAG